MKYNVAMIHSGQAQTRQGQPGPDSQSEDLVRQTGQSEASVHRASLESEMMYSDSVTVPWAVAQ